MLIPVFFEKQIDKLQKQAYRIKKWLAESDAKVGTNGRELQGNVIDNSLTT